MSDKNKVELTDSDLEDISGGAWNLPDYMQGYVKSKKSDRLCVIQISLAAQSGKRLLILIKISCKRETRDVKLVVRWVQNKPRIFNS